MPKAPKLHALVHASVILTGQGIRRKDGRRPSDADLGTIEDGAVVFEEQGTIRWVGSTKDLPKTYSRIRKTDLKNRRAVIPGLVDCHTHLVFAGDRSEEFAARCGGATYEEIAAQGGGILATVKATRNATVAQLERLAVARVREAISFGIRTIEIKSGYGLNLETEMKVLRVAHRLRDRFPEVTFFNTFLGAHAFPREKSRAEYMRELLDEMIPHVAAEKLADACDVFVDDGYFTVEEGRQILLRAKEYGLKTKLHADELANTESASLAVEMGALSADHLLRISDAGIRGLADSQTVGVLLPGTAFYLKAAHAPARRLIDAGACVSLATDFNPGTCMTLNLPAVMTIAALYLGMSRSEIFAAVTYNAAKALDLHHRKGTIEVGQDADLTVLPFETFEETYYRFAWAPR